MGGGRFFIESLFSGHCLHSKIIRITTDLRVSLNSLAAQILVPSCGKNSPTGLTGPASLVVVRRAVLRNPQV